MPLGAFEKEVDNNAVVRFRKEAIKYRYSTLCISDSLSMNSWRSNGYILAADLRSLELPASLNLKWML
jgi:hypothetical protein